MAVNGPKLSAAFLYYERLRRVRDYVETNYADEVHLREAAQIAGLEEKYFSSYFHKRTGICFKDWLAGFRVARAKTMMQSQDHSITEVAYAVGFRDLRTFERAFKRCVGITPRSFKSAARPA